jgi:hypothetical protein
VAPLERATRLYLLAFSALIMLASARTLIAARGGEGHLGGLAQVLSGVELLAALGFVFRPTRPGSGLVLTLVFLVAALVHGLHDRDVPMALLVYLATTLYLLKATRAPEPVACA